jgi:hypothetical protein
LARRRRSAEEPGTPSRNGERNSADSERKFHKQNLSIHLPAARIPVKDEEEGKRERIRGSRGRPTPNYLLSRRGRGARLGESRPSSLGDASLLLNCRH